MANQGLQRIEELPYAEFYLAHNYVENAEELMEWLINNLEWEQGQVRVFGKVHNERRQTIFFSSRGNSYTYSGREVTAHPFPEQLEIIRADISRIAGVEFDSLLVNYYENGLKKIGMHSDSEISLQPGMSIASVSLGATRHFDIHMKPMKNTGPPEYAPNHGQTELIKHRIDLRSGDLLIMGENAQRNYMHGIPEEKRVTTPRVSLTFRVTK